MNVVDLNFYIKYFIKQTCTLLWNAGHYWFERLISNPPILWIFYLKIQIYYIHFLSFLEEIVKFNLHTVAFTPKSENIWAVIFYEM